MNLLLTSLVRGLWSDNEVITHTLLDSLLQAMPQHVWVNCWVFVQNIALDGWDRGPLWKTNANTFYTFVHISRLKFGPTKNTSAPKIKNITSSQKLTSVMEYIVRVRIKEINMHGYFKILLLSRCYQALNSSEWSIIYIYYIVLWRWQD